MTDEPTNRPLEAVNDEALEARIVAWILGEASAFEAAELEKRCAEDPEAALFARRMRMLDGFIRDEGAETERLPEEKRAKVMEVMGSDDVEGSAEAGSGRGRAWGRAALRKLPAVAAVLLLGAIGAFVTPMVVRQQKSAKRMESPIVSRLAEMAEAVPPSSASPGSDEPTILGGGLRSGDATVTRDSISGLLNDRGSDEGRPPALRSEVAAKPSAPTSSASQTIASNTATPKAVPVPEVDAPGLLTDFADGDGFGAGWGGLENGRADGVTDGADRFAGDGPPPGDVPTLGRLFDQQRDGANERDSSPAGREMIRRDAALTGEHAENVDEVRRKLYAGQGNYDLGKFDDAEKAYEEALRIDPSNNAARRGMEKVEEAKSSYYRAAYDQTRAELLTEVDEAWDMAVPAEISMPERQTEALDLMAEVAAADEPFSTFSLHVSDASFKLAVAALNRGERPAAAGIRPEEFYNAFDYGDPGPSAGEPVACTLEQAAHPAFPQRNLLRIAVRTGASGRAQSVPLNLTLLLDNSGSMERPDRSDGVARAVRQLSTLLKAGDQVTMAGFSRTPRLLADRLDGGEAAKLNEIVGQIPAEGGTNLEQALALGGELATRQYVPGAQNRVVLFTDGAANLGDADPESLNTRVEALRQNGIAFDAAGFGADGLNDRLLERLTRNGNGRYYVIDDPSEADEGFADKLAGAFRPAAENVKVQVVFNPERVGQYKLIGFEEHRLKKEDFRDDSVDAAEMAAEEAGVALYQIETLPEGRGEVGEVRVRFRDAASGRMVERNWTIPYESDAPPFDRAAESIQLAALAAFAAEKLRDAPMAGLVDFEELAPVIGRVMAKYAESDRVAELGRMLEVLREK